MSRWTYARMAQLLELVGRGLSASVIADALGVGITRNMVIGKLSRLGLPLGSNKGGRPRTGPGSRGGTPGRPRKSPAQPWKPHPVPRHQPAPFEPPTDLLRPHEAALLVGNIEPATIADQVTISGLRFPIRQCRWIDGEASKDSLYCGAATKPGSSYCPDHHARVWQTVASRRAYRKHLAAAE